MHGLWMQTIEEIGLVFVQAVVITGTYLLHRLTKAAEQMIQAHMASLKKVMSAVNFDDTTK